MAEESATRKHFLGVKHQICTIIQVPYGIPNRAYETLADEVSISRSKLPEAGLGVIAQTFIRR